MEGEMERPDQDDRSYRLVTLNNKLEVLLIHDINTEKAGAALDVNVGSFSDPDDTPGIAHAVEHLLSMGTKKYPNENDYEAFLAQQDGYSNAFTCPTSTNYYFELSYPALARSADERIPALMEALDRFGQFFISPLFLMDAITREVMAVDSEYKKNMQDDNWRLHHVKKALANPGHPYHRFAAGNRKTLHDDPIARGVSVQHKIKEFFLSYYSANRMKLVVLGRENLNTLQEWAESIFSEIPNKDLPPNRWDMPLYNEDQLLTQAFVKPVLEKRSLELQFMHRDEELLYESHPSWYMAYLLGHKGPGSIFALVRANGWAYDIEAGGYTPCQGSGLFTVTVELTKSGVVRYKEIVKIIFQYVAMVRRRPPQEWLVDEIMQICKAKFRFEQDGSLTSTVSSLASVMQRPYNRSKLLSGPRVIQRFDRDLIRQSNSYIGPDNFRLIIVSPDFPGGWDKEELWSGAEFKVAKMSRGFLDDLRESFGSKEKSGQFRLPYPSAFISTRFDVDKREVKSPATVPKLIKHNKNVRTWWKKDDQFWVPRGHIHVYFRTPIIGITVRAQLTASLFINLVHDALDVQLYDANVSGLNYDMSSHSGGFEIDLSGYNEKLHILLETVLFQVRDLTVKEDRFRVIRDRMMDTLRNLGFEEPWEQVSSYSDAFRSPRGFISEDLPRELETITVNDVIRFGPQIFEQCQIEVLAHGNIIEEEALRVTELVERTMAPTPLPTSQLPISRSLILPPGSNFVYEKELPNPKNVSHCVEYNLYAGHRYDGTVRAKLHLLSQLTEEPCFNQLRTIEQLGYLVSSGLVFYEAWAGYSISIQSELDCGYLESRIDCFLILFEKRLRDLSEEDFESHKSAITSSLCGKLINMEEEDARFWNHITNDSYDFLQAGSDAKAIARLTKETMLNFFARFISPSSPQRAKLSVHLVANGKSSKTATAEEELTPKRNIRALYSIDENSKYPNAGLTNTSHPVMINDCHAWRASMPTSPGVRPVKSMEEFAEV
ncbi:insulin-degrading enzyme [Phaeosphaeriaceae sp. PMI808]|nr:insulin-degrading enzyme [Phaeosphaeriaceae sp. PMI808]